ncbi:hypothetical protein [Caulobacter henricii]|uniref:Uncharacterized protein n=1 Tax=Caulobacter henricii TaxID=69395 RepID=A0A0P0NXW0_9CAUL|nr:hypothetical protein [Caulobacter henricii]ALL12480.1 hypothetical protein AQ619_03420 [Caulobacter henricii]
MPDVFKFDPAAKTVTFEGDEGLELLYDLLLRAKFGDGYEKPLLVSPWLAALLKRLDQALPDDGQWFPERPGQPIFDTDDLLAMGDAVIEEGHTVGWWTMTPLEKRAYLRETVAAPHPLTDLEVAFIEDDIDAALEQARRLVQDADETLALPGHG